MSRGPSGPAARVEQVQEALAEVHRRVGRAGADPTGLTVVAVTKGHGVEAAVAAVGAGLLDLGENYASELADKDAELNRTARVGTAPGIEAPPIRWHFLGGIQRNKIRSVASLVNTWQSVDRLAEAETIAGAAPATSVMVQVLLSPGPGRGGCRPEELEDLVEAVRRRVEVRGLMGVGPPGPAEQARPAFRWLTAAARRLGLAEVSMGMSNDLEVAVQEGSTMLRLGTALFGSRVQPPRPTASPETTGPRSGPKTLGR